MKIDTLSSRLFLILSGWTVIAVAVIAFLISLDYRNNAERRFEELLSANIYTLMGGVRRDEKGQLAGSPDLGDARYNQFDSGWYWSINEVSNTDNNISSASLSSQSIEVPASVVLGRDFQRQFSTVDVVGNGLTGLEAQVILGEGEDLFSFKITGNKSAVDEEVSSFIDRILLFLGLFGVSLVLASYFLVRIGLRPLKQATDVLAQIREGKADRLTGKFPMEIQPLIDETNALISSNKSVVERARTQVGNLAHSLKTPIAVVTNELREKPTKSSKLVLEQISRMQQQVQVYLDRARISARHATVTSRTDVMVTIAKLVDIVGKLNPEISIQFDKSDNQELFIAGRDLYFAGDESDFQEVIGNLLENAAKYAVSSILVSVSVTDTNTFDMVIEDDGPGLTAQEMEVVMARGNRLDESVPGSGLGLSIVDDIIKEYQGHIEMSQSALGGLAVKVTLPVS